jgi:phosphopentomutase
MKGKFVLIVMDSVGIGAMPDAHLYSDQGSDTLGNIYRAVPELRLNHLDALGLSHIDGVSFPQKNLTPIGSFGRAMARFPGKDTTGGHWEIAGLILDKPFPTFANGFPDAVIKPFEAAIGRGVLGNIAASGTEIIKSLGEEHMQSGKPIVYTSADSVFQIAAHEDIIPVSELYRMCEQARGILTGDYRVGRVIARPFAGPPGAFVRTPRRRDYSVEPPSETVLDALKAHGHSVCGVGKIEDIFAHRGLTHSDHTADNEQSVAAVLRFMREQREGLIFANLVDFDALYGHRNDPHGYARALEAFDAALPALMSALGAEDILLVTADHGCDPTTPSTDHSREYVPILCYGQRVKANVNLGTRRTFADIAATMAEYFGLERWGVGTSFYHDIIKEEQ